MSSNATNQVDLEMGPVRSPSPPGSPNAVLAELRAQLTTLLQQQSAKLDGIPNEASVNHLLETQISPILARTGNIEHSLEQFKASVAEVLKQSDGLKTEEVQQLALTMVQKAEQYLVTAEVPHGDWMATKAYAEIGKILSDIREAGVRIQKSDAEMKKIEVDTRKAEAELVKIEVDTRKAEAELVKIEVETRKAEAELEKIELETRKAAVEIREKKANIAKMKDEKHRGWTSIAVAILALLLAFFGGVGFARFVQGQ